MSSDNPAKSAVAAAGKARITIVVPGTSRSSLLAMIARSLRFTKLRVTALPTAFDTTKPTDAGPGVMGSRNRCTTRVLRAPRTPRRTARSKSAEWRRRCAVGSTARIRPRARCDPCRDVQRGSRALRECASEDGSHGSWPDVGCSAGRSAWSRQSPTMGKVISGLPVMQVSGRVMRSLSRSGAVSRTWGTTTVAAHNGCPKLRGPDTQVKWARSPHAPETVGV